MNRLWRCFLVLLLLASGGCQSSGPGLIPVTGKLMCDGQPAAGALLFLHGQDAPAHGSAAEAPVPSARVAGDGTFSVQSPPHGAGAPPGRYAVLVQWPTTSSDEPVKNTETTGQANRRGGKLLVSRHQKVDPVQGDRLKGRYLDRSRPVIVADVQATPLDLGVIEVSLPR